jgi:hypothetical protein
MRNMNLPPGIPPRRGRREHIHAPHPAAHSCHAEQAGETSTLAVNDGLTELREMKRTMLSTVCRFCLAGLIVVGFIALIVAATQSRFWPDLMERFNHP